MGQGLAHDHRPRLAQTLHAQRIPARPVPLKMRRAIGGDVINGIDIVLHRHGYALQRPKVLPLGKQRIGLARLGQGDGGIDLDKGVTRRVQPRDGVQGGLGQLDACQAARAQAFGQRRDRLATKISSVNRLHQAHANNSIKQRRE